MEQPYLSRARGGIHTRHLFASAALAVIVAVFGGPLSAQTTRAATETRNKAIIERSFNAWRDGIGGPYDLLAENATWTILGRSMASKTYDSREAFMRDVIRPFNARMSIPLRPEIRNLVARLQRKAGTTTGDSAWRGDGGSGQRVEILRPNGDPRHRARDGIIDPLRRPP